MTSPISRCLLFTSLFASSINASFLRPWMRDVSLASRNPQAGGMALMNGQCGGQTYSGPNTCPSGQTCLCLNTYWWQCMASGSNPASTCPGGAGGPSGAGSYTSGSSGGSTINQGGLCGGTSYTGSSQCASGLKCLCSDRTKSFCQPSDWRPGTDCPASGGNGGQGGQSGQGGGTTTTNARPYAFYAQGPSGTPTPSPSPSAQSGGSGRATGGYSGIASTSNYYDGTAGSCGCHVVGGSQTVMAPWQLNPKPGWFTAAGTANLFGSTAGTGNAAFCGTGCGTCYELSTTGKVPAGEGAPQAAGTTWRVMLTNLCPADQSAKWCTQPTNQYGYTHHFDILHKGDVNGIQNPEVQFKIIDCPSDLASNFATCQCQGGKDTGRKRRRHFG